MGYQNDEESGGNAPFNLALTTLMDIRQILREIRWVSTYDMGQTPGQNQHTKWKLVKQLFIQSTPLLKDEKQAEIKKNLDKISPKWIKKVDAKYMYVGKSGFAERFDPGVDKALDEVTIQIQDALQAEGYFMPPHEDYSGL